MKKKLLLFFVLLSMFNAMAQSQSNKLPINKKLIPQEIEYDGKPNIVYRLNGKKIVLSFETTDMLLVEGRSVETIRMKIYGKKEIFKPKSLTKTKRIYFNKDYTITFFDIKYTGECTGEGTEGLKGKILIQTKKDENTLTFDGIDDIFSSDKCKEVGNG